MGTLSFYLWIGFWLFGGSFAFIVIAWRISLYALCIINVNFSGEKRAPPVYPLATPEEVEEVTRLFTKVDYHDPKKGGNPYLHKAAEVLALLGDTIGPIEYVDKKIKQIEENTPRERRFSI